MNESSVIVKAALYPLEAVYKSCYSFFDRAFIRLEGDPAGDITILLKSKTAFAAAEWTHLVGEFENELIHQALRAKVAFSNQAIREHIVARALASAEGELQRAGPARNEAPKMDEALEKEIEKLLAEVENQAEGDPLGIVAPWDGKAAPETKKAAPETKKAASEKKKAAAGSKKGS